MQLNNKSCFKEVKAKIMMFVNVLLPFYGTIALIRFKTGITVRPVKFSTRLHKYSLCVYFSISSASKQDQLWFALCLIFHSIFFCLTTETFVNAQKLDIKITSKLTDFDYRTIPQISAKGTRLENYYVQPKCTPSRSQFLSGRYQVHFHCIYY